MNSSQLEKSGSFGTVTDLGNSVIKRYKDISESYYEELNAYALDAYSQLAEKNNKVINLLGREGNSLIFAKYYPIPPNIDREFLFINCCLSLHEFYIRNLSHQDIALRNILIDNQGIPVLIDIGGTTRFGFSTGIVRSYPGYSLEYNIGHYQDIYLLGETMKQLWNNPPQQYEEIINSMMDPNIYKRPTTKLILERLGVTPKPRKLYPKIDSYLISAVSTSDYEDILSYISKLEATNQVFGTLARLGYVLLSRGIPVGQIHNLLKFVISYIDRRLPFETTFLPLIELAKIDFPCNPYWYDTGLSSYWLKKVVSEPLIVVPLQDIINPELPSIRGNNLRTYNINVLDTQSSSTYRVKLNMDPKEYVGVLKFSNLVYPEIDIFYVPKFDSTQWKNSYLLSPDRIYLEGIICVYNNKYISITSANELSGINKINEQLGIKFELKSVIGTGITLL